MTPARRAWRLAEALVETGRPARPSPERRRPTRILVVGDPQTSAERFFAVLEHRGLLAEDGWLRPDVGLVSIGDHFDPSNVDDPVAAGREGLRILEWLAVHPVDQVLLLLGNHDAARVMELAGVDDVRFEAARTAAAGVQRARKDSPQAGAAAQERFRRDFPEMPLPLLVARDYGGYSEAQGRLVRRLLLEGRFRLAAAGRRQGSPVLLTHAGVTLRELRLLGVEEEREPQVLAAALQGHLARALAGVRDAWERGEAAPLSLAPLYLPASALEEAGGLLYHRPAHPQRPPGERGVPDFGWEFSPLRPRRFDPLLLPQGLVQVAGHTGHTLCRRELAPWLQPGVAEHRDGRLRTLCVEGQRVRYLEGTPAVPTGAAALHLVDGEMAHVDPSTYELLELDEVG